MAQISATLPLLDGRRTIERAHLTQLQLGHERALERYIAQALGLIGQRIALSLQSDGVPGPALKAVAIGNALLAVMRPSLVATAVAFKDRLVAHPKCAHAFNVYGNAQNPGFRGFGTPEYTKAAFDDLDGAIAEYMAEHTAEAVVGISESLREVIANAIRQGQEENLSVEELARLIVDTTAGEIGLARARRIARTETHAAAMYGQQLAAQASPLQFNKTWLATEDSRTRADHAEANGQTVALDEPFVVGDVEMAYPGDPTAPAGQIINCRCVALYEPIV
jgi:Phage Mu protein F like protein